MTETTQQQPPGLPTWAYAAAWDTVLILGDRCSAKDTRKATRRAKALAASGADMQPVWKGMTWALGVLMALMCGPGGADPKYVIDIVMEDFDEMAPATTEFRDAVVRVMERGATQGEEVQRDTEADPISGDEAAALGYALWLLAGLNDAVAGRVYFTNYLMAGSINDLNGVQR